MRTERRRDLRRGQHGEVGKRPRGEVEDDAVGTDGTQPAPLVNGLLVAPHGLVRGDDRVAAASSARANARSAAWISFADVLVGEVAAVGEAQHPTVAMLCAPRRATVSDLFGQPVPLLSGTDASPPGPAPRLRPLVDQPEQLACALCRRHPRHG